MENQIGKRIFYRSEVTSTQAELAVKLAAESLPSGTILQAGFQTRGKGQRDKYWESNRGENLLFSMYLEPDIPVGMQFYLNFAIGLAVLDTLKTLLGNRKVKIKWPNDLYIDKKKIAGILIENQIQKDKIKSSIIGIGINVRQREFLTDKPVTSLLKLGLYSRPSEVLDVFCKKMGSRWEQLLGREYAALEAAYNKQLYGLGERRKFREVKGNVFIAKVKRASADGHLVLEINGEDTKWSNGEISWEGL